MGRRKISRRRFVGSVALGVPAGLLGRAGAAESAGARSAEPAVAGAPAVGPVGGDKVRVGFIGVGNRGDQLLEAFLPQPDCQVVALCDVYRPYLEFSAKKVGGSPELFADHRKLLDRKDLHAVVIATPDHWHAIQLIDACRAGKDAYVEKPLSLTVVEGRRMVEVARRENRIVQVGLQRRSAPVCARTAEIVRSGKLGKVSVAKSFHVLNETPPGIGKAAPSAPPPGLDWDRWLGPAPFVPYLQTRCHYKFRWFWDYSGGQLTNFGTHYMDVIQWALGRRAPRTVTAVGGKYAVDDDREIPDTLEVAWTYDGGTLVTFSQYNANAAPTNTKDAHVEFRGTLGTLYLGYSGIEVVPELVRVHQLPARNPLDRDEPAEVEARIAALKVEGGMANEPHVRNFLDCVKSREEPACDIETGHRSTTATLLGNVALRVGRTLEWDAEREVVTNSPEANRWLSKEYRAPWKL